VASSTFGGSTLAAHSVYANTLSLIAQGTWDYVILQEQSQLPSFDIAQVEAESFPYAHILDSLIRAANPCAETLFYMTWGRKNGDAGNCATWPPVCTYDGMDSLLNLRYRMMAEMNDAVVSPVGAIWHKIRDENSAIELYAADESHPSPAGTYAAACSFYEIIFGHAATQITSSYSLPVADAEFIRNTAHDVISTNEELWYIGAYQTLAGFTSDIVAENAVQFVNTSENADQYFWDFGDGSTSEENNPLHQYAQSGDYEVTLTATNCDQTSTISTAIFAGPVNIDGLPFTTNHFVLYPNPIEEYFTLESDNPDVLQITLFDTMGNLVLSTREYSGNRIGINTLRSGLYFLKLRTQSGKDWQTYLIKY
jgi:PKD domain/Secretion system C-terminal sorting domain